MPSCDRPPCQLNRSGRVDARQVRPLEESVAVPDSAGDLEMPQRTASSAATAEQEVRLARP